MSIIEVKKVDVTEARSVGNSTVRDQTVYLHLNDGDVIRGRLSLWGNDEPLPVGQHQVDPFQSAKLGRYGVIECRLNKNCVVQPQPARKSA